MMEMAQAGGTSNSLKPCGHCGGYHLAKCLLVKAIEYHPDGTVKRVEYYTPNDYAPTLTAYPTSNTRATK